MKVCPKCKVEKCEQEFYKSQKTKDKLFCWCKKCMNLKDKIYKAKNIELKRAYETKIRPKHLEKHRKLAKLYYQKYKQEFLAYEKQKAESLQPSYLKTLARSRNFTKERIEANPEILEALKLIIKIKRHVKAKTNN